MRVPLEWLREYCAPPLDAAALADRLAMTGTEVERVERHGVGALDHFVVGRILEADRHPDADRLRVCLVDTGDRSPSQIVCGAPNVAAGQTVAVAKPGAVMPDGRTLGRARLWGIESDGMILAEDELAIGTEHDGIVVLEEDGLEPGTPLTGVFPLSTEVLVLEITPNRPDCLAVYGVAREVHAATNVPLSPRPWADDPGNAGDPDAVVSSRERVTREIKVTVESPELCPRFTARVFEDVRIGPSPPWLKARLMAAGQRPISNVVDITNYAMLLTGQPLHAFDLDRIAGQELVVRRARDREALQTLDGLTRALDGDMILIADRDGPASIAGVMGGARSEVEAQTTRVLMESATWNGANIHRTSLRLGVRSEASTRFEKQLQPEQALDAQAVAARLMIELCGARLMPGTLDIGGPGPRPRPIRLRDARVSGLLGTPISRERSREILRSLEFATADAEDGLDVTPPVFRRDDVTREADLIEEVARLDGLEKLPATLPSRHGAWGRLTGSQQLRRRAADALTAQGLHETVGWSFVSRESERRVRLAPSKVVELENPMSADQAQLRTSLLTSLLDTARRNRARGAGALRLFEAGAVYLPSADPGERLPHEPYHVGVLLAGASRDPTWREPAPRPADLFAAKGVLQGLLDSLRTPWTVRVTNAHAFLHPGRSATIRVADGPVGWLGEIHPVIAAGWDLEDTIAAFELDLDAVAPHAVTTPLHEDLTSFPDVREDLAVVVADHLTAAEVVALVLRAGAPLVKRAEVFDVYRDPQRVGAGNVSLAIALTYRAPDRTLTAEEVAVKRQAVVAALQSELDGRVRGA